MSSESDFMRLKVYFLLCLMFLGPLHLPFALDSCIPSLSVSVYLSLSLSPLTQNVTARCDRGTVCRLSRAGLNRYLSISVNLMAKVCIFSGERGRERKEGGLCLSETSLLWESRTEEKNVVMKQ